MEFPQTLSFPSESGELRPGPPFDVFRDFNARAWISCPV